MDPVRRRAFIAAALCLGTALAFFLTAVVALPVPLYLPLSRRWALGPGAAELSMDYYGRSLVALCGGALAALLADLGLRLRPRARGPALALVAAWAATALVLCASLYAYKLAGRDLAPEPLPAWYEPR